MKDPLGFIPPLGNYSQLQSYRKAEVVYDLTYRFCHRFLSQKDRTIDQMIQAARSGKQNIVEGSEASGASALDFRSSRFIITPCRPLVRSRNTPMKFSIKISPAILASIFILTATVSAWAANSTVNVLYAGSLVNLMERSAGPAFEQKSGDRFQGYAGGSNQVANEIKGKLRRGDVFISANPKVDEQLMGQANGDWVQWYIAFAESPLVIGYNPSNRFLDDLKNKSWYAVLAEPGIKIGRTDPKLDPKGALTIELLKRAEVFYSKPGLSEQIIGAPDNQSQILPEETLVGRLQSGQLDVGFFYSTETSAAKILAIKLPDEIAPKASYTLTILRDAPNPDGAERFVSFFLGPQGRELLTQYGLELFKPDLSGNVQAVPTVIRSLVDAAQ